MNTNAKTIYKILNNQLHNIFKITLSREQVYLIPGMQSNILTRAKVPGTTVL